MRTYPCLFLLTAFTPLASAQNAADVEAVVTTDLGSFRIQFFPEKAPKHVAQFLSYSQKGFYDRTAFFRVLANGLIQGGDPLLKTEATSRPRWGTGGFNTLPSEF
ncbi:MAG: peptidylprolyl isomerase, partial [Acidobacteriota bacterium]|nr:peptidylprolyl isomerase [Acidobacteriota bacterium]